MAERDASADVVSLQAQLEQQQATIAALNNELAETNQGVVALYAELDDRAEQLREATELKSRFLSYMSHEFRTPLGSIRSLARILIDHLDGPLNDEQMKQVEFIRSAASELTEMVDDLLDLAKIEAGRVVISTDWFELVDLFTALRGMFRPVLENSSVRLIFEQSELPERIYTDHQKLAQILRNFISNALKFTPKGEVRVSGAVADGWITFAVKDTGIGIAQEHLPLLFRDFVQLSTPVHKNVRGSGLGLSLSKRLAELLGGKVRVESVVGEGSTFYITLPVEPRRD